MSKTLRNVEILRRLNGRQKKQDRRSNELQETMVLFRYYNDYPYYYIVTDQWAIENVMKMTLMKWAFTLNKSTLSHCK